jgi:hypothetical protein
MGITRRTFKSAADLPEMATGEPAGEQDASDPADVAPVPETALAKAQAALAANDAEIVRLVAERNALLVRDEVDEVAVGHLDDKLAGCRHRAKTLTDRLSLLAAEAARVEAEQAAQAREEKITQIEAILARRDKAAEDLQLHLCKAEAAFREVHEFGQAARNGWAWPHGRAGAVLASGQDLFWGVSSFIYKIGGRAGQMSPDGPPSFPGARCPKLELLGTPEALPDLVDEFRAASKYASDCMRGIVPAAVTPEPAADGPDEQPAQPAPVVAAADGPSVPPISPEVAQLLVRQSVLAARDMTAADEQEYRRNGEQIAALSAS